jgi:hypothetical protein
VLCRDWLHKQAAKAEAAAAAAQARADSEAQPNGKRRRPTIRFQQGDTAEASVLNMFEAKHMGDKVNRDVVRQVFECVFSSMRGVPMFLILVWVALHSNFFYSIIRRFVSNRCLYEALKHAGVLHSIAILT